MREAEGLRPRPCFEIGPASPDRVRRVEHMVFPFRPAQQVELDKAGDVGQLGVACRPDALEVLLQCRNDFESVHCDEHLCSSLQRTLYVVVPAKVGVAAISWERSVLRISSSNWGFAPLTRYKRHHDAGGCIVGMLEGGFEVHDRARL